MLTQSPYLDWITHFYPRVRHNLAASGIPNLSIEETSGIDPHWCNDPVARLAESLAENLRLPGAELLACNGGSQALWLAYAATLRAGEEALVESPAYAPFADTASALGAHVRRFARLSSEDYALDADAICRSLSPKTRVVALSHLHNPSGNPAAPEAVAVIAAAIARQHGHVIVNETYAPFHECGAEGPRLRSARSIAPNVVCVGSLSKAYGLGRERIGWLTGPEQLIRQAASARLASIGDPPPQLGGLLPWCA